MKYEYTTSYNSDLATVAIDWAGSDEATAPTVRRDFAEPKRQADEVLEYAFADSVVGRNPWRS